MRRKKMFFDKNEDNEVKIVDEVLSNDSFDKLSVDLVDIDFTLVGGDQFEVHYHGPEDKKPIVTNTDKALELREPKVERKNGKFWKRKHVEISIVSQDDIGALKVTVPVEHKIANATLKLTSGDTAVKQVELETLTFTALSGDLHLKKVKVDEVAITETSGDI